MKSVFAGAVALAVVAMLAVLSLQTPAVAGITSYERVEVSSQDTFVKNQKYLMVATCPPGKVVLGGGYGALSLGGNTPVLVHQAGTIATSHLYRIVFIPTVTFSGFYVQAVCATP